MNKILCTLIFTFGFVFYTHQAIAGIGFIANNNSRTASSRPNNTDKSQSCANKGYTLTSCGKNELPNNFCPYDSKFFKKCICRSSHRYDATNCSKPKEATGEVCQGKYTKCRCPSNYKACQGNKGVGEPCREGSQFKFAKCSNNCEDAGYQSSIIKGERCEIVMYNGRKCYTNCYLP